MKRRMSALLLALALVLSLPALAVGEEAPQMQPLPAWSHEALADVNALGLWSDEYYYCHQDPVTQEQMDKIATAVAAKLALLERPAREPDFEEKGLVTDLTKGGVINRLYLELASWSYDGIGVGAGPAVLFDLGVVKGGGEQGDDYSRPCTLLEALVMARRLVLAAYDACGAGSKGLLWKATNGENTLWLLGTVHVDRGNVYPFHSSLRSALASAQDVMFEVDFGDVKDAEAYVALQFYTDGTTLKDHVSSELYAKAVKAGVELGLTEAQTASYKAWVLANTFQSMGLSGGDSGSGQSGSEAPVVIDTYLYAQAANTSRQIGAAESMTYQGGLFDSLSPEYQEAYLSAVLDAYYGGGQTEENSAAAGIDAMLEAWKTRDFAAFDKSFDKDEVLKNGDELEVKLYVERDPGMIEYAADYLSQDGAHTGFLAVGAGHMVGKTGIVQGLKDLGYTVEPAA